MSRKYSRWLRRVVGAGTIAALAITATACSSEPEAKGGDEGKRTITIGYSARAPFVLPALLAEAGITEFEKRGITFKGQLVSAPDALPLLATGKLDVFAGPISAGVFNAIGTGADIRIVAPGGSSTIASNWYISKAALGGKPYSLDLWKDKTVYTSTGAGSYVMISLAHELAAAGLKPTDLKFAQIPPDDVGPALKSGAIFAGIPASVKVRNSLLEAGDIIAGPSAVWPVGISPGFLFFGSSLMKDAALSEKVLAGFADLYTGKLQGDFLHNEDLVKQIAKVLDYDVKDVPTLVTFSYPADLSFPAGWTENAESVWRGLPDVLSYQGSVADKVVATDLIEKALKAAKN